MLVSVCFRSHQINMMLRNLCIRDSRSGTVHVEIQTLLFNFHDSPDRSAWVCMCVCVCARALFISLTLSPKRVKKAKQSNRGVIFPGPMTYQVVVRWERALTVWMRSLLTSSNPKHFSKLCEGVEGKWLLKVAKTFLSHNWHLAAWQAGLCRSVRSICLKFW